MDNIIQCFHLKGKKQSSIFFDCPISCMTQMENPMTKLKYLLVALKNGEIRIYNNKFLVHTLELKQEIQGMVFGTYGREDGSLCIIISLRDIACVKNMAIVEIQN